MGMLPSGLPNIVGDDEEITRFLTQSSHYNSAMPKPAAFMPDRKIGLGIRPWMGPGRRHAWTSPHDADRAGLQIRLGP